MNPNKLIEDMNSAAGRVHCPSCSTDNWKVFHLPDICPSKKARHNLVDGIAGTPEEISQEIAAMPTVESVLRDDGIDDKEFEDAIIRLIEKFGALPTAQNGGGRAE